MSSNYIVMVRSEVPLDLGEKVVQAHAQAVREARRLQEAQARSGEFEPARKTGGHPGKGTPEEVERVTDAHPTTAV